MPGANNTAGLVGRFGSTSFISVTSSLAQKDPRLPPKYPKTSRFFKSRNLKDVENVIEEEAEEVDTEDQARARAGGLGEEAGEEPSALSTCSSNSSIDSTIVPNTANNSLNSTVATAAANNSLNSTVATAAANNSLNSTVATAAANNSLNSTIATAAANNSLNSTVAAAATTPQPKLRRKDTNISVAVRSRPILASEQAKDPPETSVLDISEDQVIVALSKPFRFDRNFTEASSQQEVYNAVVKPFVSQVVKEYNASVFAYGQTGTGKTYTMGTNNKTGDLDHPNLGIIPRAIQQLFAEGSGGLTVEVSFYEILNEQVFDLIGLREQRGPPLDVREMPNLGLFKVSQLTQQQVTSAESALDLLEQGSLLRSTESTGLNSASSRSHAVFTLTITSENEDGNLVTRKLNLVDLAGSESVKRTKATGDRFAEGININKGLLNLGNVIRALTEGKSHVPYRDSVLTKVLKECLLPTSYISMIACISPTGADMNETVNTLRFANKAKELSIKPIPSALLNSVGQSAAKKRRFGEMIAQTPGVHWNNTIHTPTPSKTARKPESKRQLNLTIGTPGKRARGEGGTFLTPQNTFPRQKVTSTLIRAVGPGSPDSPTFSNLSGVSMIQYSEGQDRQDAELGTENDTKLESKTFSIQDMSSVLSPYMKKLTESITEKLSLELKKLNPQYYLKKQDSPKRRNRPRMTSSPVMSCSKTVAGELRPAVETESTPPTVRRPIPLVEMDGGGAERRVGRLEPLSPSETIISGTGATVPFSDLTNRRLQFVQQSASPVLGGKGSTQRSDQAMPDSPASSAPAKPRSPTIEEMERCLGIGPDSPGVLFCTPASRAPDQQSRRQSRVRSSRRTTMMGDELETTLQFIRESAKTRRLSGRPVRNAALGVFYGSPYKENNQKSRNQCGGEMSHPLLGEDTFRINPERQAEHNRSILTLLNTGNLKLLTALPAIGPKTGLIIHGYRQLNNGITSIQELETINGLGTKFYKKFLTQNQIVLDNS